MNDHLYPLSEETELTLTQDEFEFHSAMPPIYQSSLFTFASYEALEERFKSSTGQPIYSRTQNPTVGAFEKMMARLENGEKAQGFASGMAAISSVIFSQIQPGDRIICVPSVYSDSYRLFETLLSKLHITTEYISPDEIIRNPQCLKGARFLYLENPVSMTFETMNIAALAKLAKEAGVISVIDNSWATPLYQKPLDHGVDIVLHSASKYISGHSDTVAGVVISSKKYMDPIEKISASYLGGKLAPQDAFLLVRGLRTLAVRMAHHSRVTKVIIERMQNHPKVAQMNIPTIGGDTCLSGLSGLFSFILAEGADVRRFCNALRIFRLAVSWGGFESLAFPIKIGLQQAAEGNAMHRFNMSDQMIRLSIGLEHVEDLWNDLNHALNQA